MWVTAYTDASKRGNQTSWAVWLRSELGRMVTSGPCPVNVTDNNHAELYAAQRAVELAHETWGKLTGILICTDSLYVVKVLNNNATPRGAAVEMLKRIREFKDLRLRLRHQPGHQDGSDVRSYLNRQVDKLADRHTK
jgi:ribonuclease HI